jgi:hypothetical protein
MPEAPHREHNVYNQTALSITALRAEMSSAQELLGSLEDTRDSLTGRINQLARAVDTLRSQAADLDRVLGDVAISISRHQQQSQTPPGSRLTSRGATVAARNQAAFAGQGNVDVDYPLFGSGLLTDFLRDSEPLNIEEHDEAHGPFFRGFGSIPIPIDSRGEPPVNADHSMFGASNTFGQPIYPADLLSRAAFTFAPSATSSHTFGQPTPPAERSSRAGFTFGPSAASSHTFGQPIPSADPSSHVGFRFASSAPSAVLHPLEGFAFGRPIPSTAASSGRGVVPVQPIAFAEPDPGTGFGSRGGSTFGDDHVTRTEPPTIEDGSAARRREAARLRLLARDMVAHSPMYSLPRMTWTESDSPPLDADDETAQMPFSDPRQQVDANMEMRQFVDDRATARERLERSRIRVRELVNLRRDMDVVRRREDELRALLDRERSATTLLNGDDLAVGDGRGVLGYELDAQDAGWPGERSPETEEQRLHSLQIGDRRYPLVSAWSGTAMLLDETMCADNQQPK